MDTPNTTNTNSTNQNQSQNQNSMSNNAEGLKPNVAAALSYVLGFITGLIFYLISKNKFVRFHAMQSLSLAVIVFLATWIFRFMFVYGLWFMSPLVNLLYLVLSIVLIVKAYNNEMYKLPIIGDFAEKHL